MSALGAPAPVTGEARVSRPLRLVPRTTEPGESGPFDELARAASRAGWLVRRAAPTPAERDLPFGVMRALLEAPVRHAIPALHVGAAGPAATLLLRPANSNHERGIVIAHSFLWLAAAIGAGRGLALIVDDVQWSDAESLEVLAYLGRRIDDVPVLLAVAPGAGADLPNDLRAAVKRRALARSRDAAAKALRAAERLTDEGRFEEAYAMARQAGAGDEAEGIGWRSTAAIALAHLGRRGEAVTLADAELANARANGETGAIARALLARVVSEPNHAARAELAKRALDELAGRPAGLDPTRLRLELGSALTRIGRRVGAREALRQALADADRAGAKMLAQRARRELVATGLRPRRAAIHGADALTPRQRQICELAAAGKGNRAIAAELFLSVKTVETHLAASYRKLGVSTRGSLAGRIDLPGASSLR